MMNNWNASPTAKIQSASWQLRAQAEIERRKRVRQEVAEPRWPRCHISDTGVAKPFHRGQEIAYGSLRRTIAMIAGTQGGKTGFGPWWFSREVYGDTETGLPGRGAGDYLAVTATYDLFKLKMLPALLETFEDILGLGRYWAGDRILELADPETGKFKASRSSDPMWGRIILRSADALGGLESATAKAAWMDEAGQDAFTLMAKRAIDRRLALHQGRKLITTTLYNLGWVVSEVIDKAEEGGETSVEYIGDGELEQTDNAGADICLIQFDSIVNPAYPLKEFRSAEASLPADEFQLQYRGRKAKLRTLIYDVFDRKLHTCPRFPVPARWNRYLGLDFGGVNTAAVFFAEEPLTNRLYGYREYLAGGRTASEHVDALLKDEVGRPVITVGGSRSEGQWRQEFAAGGLAIKEPEISDVQLGINRVYGCHKRGEIIYFDDLAGIIDQKGCYRRKRDKTGEVVDEIENQHAFHYLDAERYIIGYLRGVVEEAAGEVVDDIDTGIYKSRRRR